MPGCPHCPDGHADPETRPWGVWVHSDRADGQPVMLAVCPSNGAHVAESDAEWLRDLIRTARAARVPADAVTVPGDLLERLAPEDAPVDVDRTTDAETVIYTCCDRMTHRRGHLDSRTDRRSFSLHADDCPWVAARRLMGDRGGLAAVGLSS